MTFFLAEQSAAEEKKMKEEKKRMLLRKLSFRPTVEELKEKKVCMYICRPISVLSSEKWVCKYKVYVFVRNL